MKTWQAILATVGLIFASAFSQKIKDPVMANAVTGSIAVVGAALAKKNSGTDPNGVPLMQVPGEGYVSVPPAPDKLKETK
jgi:hypothetical protein